MNAGDTIKLRFIAHVLVDLVTGCWEWQGANDSRGYGKFWLAGRSRRAHRVAFRLWKRPPRAGYVLLHTCDNPKCVNPGHLKEGKQKTNVRDMWHKGRAAWQRTKDRAPWKRQCRPRENNLLTLNSMLF